jgi:hypothetical protein
MREQALTWAARFSWDATADALLDVIAPDGARAEVHSESLHHPREEAPHELIGTAG